MTFRGEASYFTQTNLAVLDESDRHAALKVAAKLREMNRAPVIMRSKLSIWRSPDRHTFQGAM
jgi:hypothetical protein